MREDFYKESRMYVAFKYLLATTAVLIIFVLWYVIFKVMVMT